MKKERTEDKVRLQDVPNIGTFIENSSMGRNTSITLGEHFEKFIQSQLDSGKYGSTSEVIRSALRLLEKEEKINAIREKLIEAERSGFTSKTKEEILKESKARFNGQL